MPGGTRYHQFPELTAPASRASWSSPPHDRTVGSLTPRKASVASARTEDEIISVVWASTRGITLGSTCRDMTCQCPPPSAFARSMYGRDSTARVCARTSRAVVGQEVTPMARTTVPRERGSTVASAMARTRVGITRNQSVIRISTVAYAPLKCPAVIPTVVPIATDSAAASSPTSSDTREPHTSRASRSRPNRSVPSGNSTLGLSIGRPGAPVTLDTSVPTVSGAVSATSANRASPIRPTRPARWVRYCCQNRTAERRRRCQASARGPVACALISVVIGPPGGRAADRPGRPRCS